MGAFGGAFTDRGQKPVTKKTLVLYIGGQSNEGTDPATGKIDVAYIPAYLNVPYSNVYFYDIALGNTNAFALYTPGTNAWGWIDQMLYILSKVYTTIYVIKRAVGGTNLSTVGLAGSYPRSDFKSRSIAGKAVLNGILPAGSYDVVNLWGQGETDAGSSTYAANYATTLTNWIDSEYKSETGLQNIWIIKKISNLAKDFPYNATLRSAQDAAVSADPTYKRSIETRNLRQLGTNTGVGDYGSGDFSHTAASACIVIGTRFAERILALRNRRKQDTTTPVLQSAVIDSTGTSLTLTYSEALNYAVVPFWKQFTVGTKVFSTISISGSTVVLTPTVPFYSGQSYTISYTKNAYFEENLQDFQGNEVADVVNYSITNNATTSEPTLTTLYTSNFSAGLDGTWAAFSNCTAAAPFTSVSGAIDCAKVTHTNQVAQFLKSTTAGLGIGTFRMSFEIEIPDTFRYPDNPSGYNFQVQGNSPSTVLINFGKLVTRDQLSYIEWQWVRASGNDDVLFSSSGFTGNAYYVKNIVIKKVG